MEQSALTCARGGAALIDGMLNAAWQGSAHADGKALECRVRDWIWGP